jgi:hypothetical protein
MITDTRNTQVFDAGYAYAMWLLESEPENALLQPDTTHDIPEEDYCTLSREHGIKNPDPRTYWTGYNDAISTASSR